MSNVGVEVKLSLWLENGCGGPKNIRKCPNTEFKHATYLNFKIKVNTSAKYFIEKWLVSPKQKMGEGGYIVTFHKLILWKNLQNWKEQRIRIYSYYRVIFNE